MNSTLADRQPDDADLEQRLTVKLPAEWAFPPSWLAISTFFGLLFLYFNWMPLYHSDLWGHVLYGNWMLEHRRLPAEDPFVPLAQGIPITATAWLSQLILAAVVRLAGPDGLSHLYGLNMLAVFALLGRVYYLQTGRADLAIGGVILTMALSWGRLAFIRPEIFGLLGFSILLYMLVRSVPESMPFSDEGRLETNRWRWRWWLGIPALFLVWCNLHGSFAVGLALLACCTLGRSIQVLWQDGRLWTGAGKEANHPVRDQLKRERSDGSAAEQASIFRRFTLLMDPPARRLWLGTGLATLAAFINPYGAQLLVYTATFSNNVNLRSIGEWSRLELFSVVGLQVAIGWALLAAAFWFARRWPSGTCVVLLIVFTLAVGRQTRMLNWFATVAVLVLLPQVAEGLARRRKRKDSDSRSRIRENSELSDDRPDSEDQAQGTAQPASDASTQSDQPATQPSKPNFRYTLLTALVIWVSFILSPLGMALVANRTRPPAHLYDENTPLGVTMYLREHPPQGLIFSPQSWSEWFLWQGPPELHVFLTTNTVHVVPPRIFHQYLMLSEAHTDWERILREHDIRTVVIEKRYQPALALQLATDAGWQIQYEDHLGLVATRVSVPDSGIPVDTGRPASVQILTPDS
ncbi:MAG: hypothetical protein KJ000_00070 [Pirellulaceae bacterium]|nr:hypothetical protein [Pirellulaceae bacterium]